MAATLHQLLDLLDDRRFDVDALVLAADASEASPGDEDADGQETGLGVASHPLGREGLLAHEHPGVLVRDIEGDLHVLVSRDAGGWAAHLALRSDFCSDEDLDYFLESGEAPDLPPGLVRAVIDALPRA